MTNAIWKQKQKKKKNEEGETEYLIMHRNYTQKKGRNKDIARRFIKGTVSRSKLPITGQ